MTVKEIKKEFFENYKYIEKIVSIKTSKYDLDYDDTLNYVLEKISENDYKKISGFRGESKFSTFITVVVNRLIYSFGRKKREVPEMPTFTEETPLDILLKQQELICKEKVLKKMSDLLLMLKTNERIVLKMRYLKDLKLSEISRSLNITRYEIKNLLKVSIDFFQRKIKEICK